MSETLLTQRKHCISKVNLLPQNPYETYMKFIVSETKHKRVSRMIKTLDDSHMASRHVENLIKPVETPEFRMPETQKVKQLDPPQFFILHYSFFILHFPRMYWRHTVTGSFAEGI